MTHHRISRIRPLRRRYTPPAFRQRDENANLGVRASVTPELLHPQNQPTVSANGPHKYTDDLETPLSFQVASTCVHPPRLGHADLLEAPLFPDYSGPDSMRFLTNTHP